ncbi:sugar ABC transporter substrate-binding protein [Fictibacillus enclensis]|uniref:ABC transporter substrate-binding protein n=1 Tax=Fictibacillus enclensis TaxID=1017270 RepID=UPI0025A2C373|nr:sugar ABC transporter substrate-binding protein [Fictibacillus enclensis]MDM5340285.1 sugar ABC transporter substrate-binding protein [Fictibacillus enclensis]
MKKAWSLISLILVFILALTGCSGQSADEASGVASKKGNTLTVWAWNTNVPVLKQAEKIYAKDHKGFKLKIQEISNNDMYPKLTTSLQGGGQGLPDIVLIEDTHIQGYLHNFPKAFVNLSKKGFDKEGEKFPAYKRELASRDGNMYGMPFDGGPAGVFYRTDYFKKAGINPDSIETWDDFIAAGKTLKQKTGIHFLSLDMNSDDPVYRLMLNQQGSFYFGEDNKPALASKESQTAMKMLKKLKDDGVVNNVTGWDAWLSGVASGKVATAVSGSWMAGLIEQQAPNDKGKWGVFPLPAFEKGGNRAANIGGSAWTIPTASKNQDLAYDFLKFFSTTNKIQEIATKGGLFPTLSTVYTSPLFTEADDYFNNQKIWQIFANETKEIKAANYTGNYAIAKDEAVKAQSEILTSGKDIPTALKAAEKRLENRLSTKE